MLNLAVSTTLNTGQALDRSYEFFVEEQGLQLVEWVAHLHADSAEDVGHLMVAIKETDPVEITFESQELDFPVKEFSDQLPKV